jgi:hypothetical protein
MIKFILEFYMASGCIKKIYTGAEVKDPVDFGPE